MAISRPASGALAMLKEEHANVSDMFDRFESSDSEEEQIELATSICRELTIHAAMEERAFYPQVREALEDDELVDEALVEHATMKQLISILDGMAPDDDMFEAHVKVLGEYVRHHVKEEENEIFPQLQASEIDLQSLEANLREAKRRIEQSILPTEGGEEGTVVVPQIGETEAASASAGEEESRT